VARPRLAAALVAREDGQPERPKHDQVPRWFAALAFLRLLPHADLLPVLASVVDRPDAPFRARLAVVLALEALIARDPALGRTANAFLPRLLAFSAPDAVGNPRRHLQAAPINPGNAMAVAEDDSWQLHLAATRLRHRLGLPPLPASRHLLADPRAGVRRAFAAVLAATIPAVAATARG
jgi:hypothetical protein